MTTPRQRASDQEHNHYLSNSISDIDESLCTINIAEDLLTVHSDGVIGINKKGDITFINKVACKFTGWLPNDAKNKKIEQVFQIVPAANSNQQSSIELIKNVIDSGLLLGPINQHSIKTKNNDELLVNFSISPLNKDTVVLMFHPIIENNTQATRNLLYQVTHDALTQLKNRNAIQNTISLLHQNYKKANESYSILLIDIDRFKLINDCYGHETGDILLQLIAERIQFCLRYKDHPGRWAGEEFICLLPDTNLITAKKIAQRLCDAISSQAFLTDSQKVSITASIGMANYPLDGNNPNELFSVADSTLYEAKKNGRNRVHSSQQETGDIYSIGNKLESALSENRITPVYQPIFELSSGKQVAEEALARIQDRNGQLIEANEFIDAAVELQMIHRVDYQIIKKIITRCSEKFKQTENTLPLFVNLSANLLRHPLLVNDIIEFAKKTQVECGQIKHKEKTIVIEITEQELIGDKEKVKDLLAPFIDFGMPLAIDDFGSGYSSLTYLADLPIRYLKFDGALIQRVALEDRARKIINGIQKMAESLELITIAEHIEDQATLDVLQEIGVNWGQGYFSAKPAE